MEYKLCLAGYVLFLTIVMSGCSLCKYEYVLDKTTSEIEKKEFQPTVLSWGEDISWHFKYWLENGKYIESQNNYDIGTIFLYEERKKIIHCN